MLSSEAPIKVADVVVDAQKTSTNGDYLADFCKVLEMMLTQPERPKKTRWNS